MFKNLTKNIVLEYVVPLSHLPYLRAASLMVLASGVLKKSHELKEI